MASARFFLIIREVGVFCFLGLKSFRSQCQAMNTQNTDSYFDIFSAAAYLNCAPVTLRRAVADRQIACQRIGAGRGRIRFTRQMLDDFLARRTTQPLAQAS
jgi:hypothetical protein